jgi:hypothetical protein
LEPKIEAISSDKIQNEIKRLEAGRDQGGVWIVQALQRRE